MINKPNSTIIDNEIEALINIFPGKINVINGSQTKVIEISIISNPLIQNKNSPYCWIKLNIKFPKDYPNKRPIVTIFEKYHISENELNEVNNKIESIIKKGEEENIEVIHEICFYIQEYLDSKGKLNLNFNKKDEDIINKNNNNNDNNNNNNNLISRFKSFNIKGQNPFENIREINLKNDYSNSLSHSSDSISNNNITIHKKNSYPNKNIENLNNEINKSIDNQLQINNLKYTSRFLNDFEIKNKIGEGGGGSVYKVRNKWDDMIYAMKIIKILIFDIKQENKILLKVLNEGFVLSRLQNNHIVRYYNTWVENYDNDIEKLLNGSNEYYNTNSYNSEFSDDIVFEDDDICKKYLFIQMEYCEGNTLKEIIENNKNVTEQEKWKYIIEILDALDYIHNNNLIHRDIKPGNIFLNKNKQIKIGDFGLAKIKKKEVEINNNKFQSKKEFINNGDDLMTYNIGTKYYCSPEQEKEMNYDSKSDMYSLGIIIFEMFYSFSSFIERDKVLRKIKEKHIFPQKFNELKKINIVDLVFRLTDLNPKNRPSAKELLNSTILPVMISEESVIENFKKIIIDNKSYTEKFANILMKITCEDLNMNRNVKNLYYYTKLFSNSPFFSPIHDLEKYNKIILLIKSLFDKNVKNFKSFPLTIYDSIVKIYDNTLKRIIRINRIDLDDNDYVINKNGLVFTLSKAIDYIKEIDSYINSIKNSGSIFGILSYYTQLNNEIIYTQIWNPINTLDDNKRYIINSIELLFNFIDKLEIDNNIEIRINSSFILDYICSKVTSIKNDDKFKMLNQVKKDINKSPKEIKSFFEINGDIESMKIKGKNLKDDLSKHIIDISNLFTKNKYLWTNKKLLKLKHNIKIDFSLIPNDFIFYSGLIIQIIYHNNEKEILIAEGGNIDNFFNDSNELLIHGFGIRFKIDKLFLISEEEEEEFEMIEKLDFLMIRLKNVKNKDFQKLKIKADKFYKGNFDVIFNPQNKDEIKFDNYYNKYQMKYLIVVSNPNNIKKKSEYLSKDNEGKKEEKEEEEIEEEEEEEEEEENSIYEDLFLEIITKDNKKKVIKEKEFKWEDGILYSIQLRQPKKRKTKD